MSQMHTIVSNMQGPCLWRVMLPGCIFVRLDSFQERRSICGGEQYFGLQKRTRRLLLWFNRDCKVTSGGSGRQVRPDMKATPHTSAVVTCRQSHTEWQLPFLENHHIQSSFKRIKLRDGRSTIRSEMTPNKTLLKTKNELSPGNEEQIQDRFLLESED